MVAELLVIQCCFTAIYYVDMKEKETQPNDRKKRNKERKEERRRKEGQERKDKRTLNTKGEHREKKVNRPTKKGRSGCGSWGLCLPLVRVYFQSRSVCGSVLSCCWSVKFASHGRAHTHNPQAILAKHPAGVVFLLHLPSDDSSDEGSVRSAEGRQACHVCEFATRPIHRSYEMVSSG